MDTKHLMNTKRITTTVLILIVFALTTAACGRIVKGSGNLITESRETSRFSNVSLQGSGDVIIIQGSEESLVVATDDNIMQYVSTEVQGDTLYLDMENDTRSLSYTDLTFTLTVRDLDGLEISGSGDMRVATLETDTLAINVTGSGEVDVAALTAEEVEVTIRGSGDVSLAGTSTNQEVEVNGSGNYFGKQLQSSESAVSIRGSGNATVWATERLEVGIYGSGDVRYYGDPSLNTSNQGSGEVTHADK